MTHTFKTLAASLGLSAAVSMAATPAMAADLPAPVQPLPVEAYGQFDIEEGNSNHHRYRRYRRNRVSTGDVIAGIAIIGGIAAIASAANNSNKRSRNRDVRYDNRDYRPRNEQRRGDTRNNGESGIDGAVSMCVSSIERDVRVDRVDNVSRTSEGWQVSGTIYNGESFSCQIDAQGRIENVSYGSRFSAQAPAERTIEDRQHSANRYAAAWDKVDRDEATQGQVQSQTQPRPQQASQDYGEPRFTPEQANQRAAYPGGPIEGEVIEDEANEQAREASRTYVAQAEPAG